MEEKHTDFKIVYMQHTSYVAINEFNEIIVNTPISYERNFDTIDDAIAYIKSYGIDDNRKSKHYENIYKR